ncbi:hypothetical protein [Brevundimonas sp.]|uniref:hypothetical protein n=1 Tax=Brevundimonas sp. TaxID=1871086 RepID=UPI003D11527E
MGGRAFYEVADKLLARKTGTQLALSFHCCAEPVRQPPAWATSPPLATFETFFKICLDIFSEALSGQQGAEVYRWLMNDTPVSLRRAFHRSLPEAVYRRPQFFRTDEGADGRVVEIQCPGSGWGDLQLLKDLYIASGRAEDRLEAYRPAEAFVREVIALTGSDHPSVLHLLDNASAPASIRYHMATTAPPLRYWGYSADVDNARCDLVRSHSVFGLVAENRFKQRLRQAAAGEAIFDLPPIILFDQKAPLALPFWEMTRDRFPEAVRELLAYTYPLALDGFRTPEGDWLSLEDLVNLPASKRRYFVKYAGSDVSVNWGSQSVWRTADNGFAKKLDDIRAEMKSGRPWIIQADVGSRTLASTLLREADEPTSETRFVKYSRFYGPTQSLGAKAMFAATPKVHGQSITTVGLVL